MAAHAPASLQCAARLAIRDLAVPPPKKTLSPAAEAIVQYLPYASNSAHWFARVRDLGTPVWLDSAWPFSQRGRYDIISAAPLILLTPNDSTDFFTDIQEALDQFAPIAKIGDEDLPFHGGAIMLLGYEYGRGLHAFPTRPTLSALTDDDPDFSSALAGVYSWAIVNDHLRQRTTLIIRAETPAALREELRRRVCGTFVAAETNFALTSAWVDDFPAAIYQQAFARLQEYIRAGDCYQVNLARRFHADYRGDPFAAYLQLREIAAAPYSAYFEYKTSDNDNTAVMCLSPERFLAANARELLTQPIKGTAPRDSDPTRDRELARRLQLSEKNRAENLMIVDLLRNDLGRSCKPGSIHVERLFELQSFATVHHLVSSIRGELRDDMHALDALKYCFPGGSITGAPKHRAMQIIDELEPNARSLFCGSIGYIDANGNMDTNITIRTLLAHQLFDQQLVDHELFDQKGKAQRQTIYAWAGGGIVADSDGDEELQETNNKIEALLRALSAMNTP